MTRVFATVGTTSFDALVRALCSLPFLAAAAAHCHDHCNPHPPCPRHTDGETRATSSPSSSSPSSSPSPSGPSSASAAGCGGHSASCASTSSSSSRGAASSFTFSGDDALLEVAIQYGRGECPLAFISPSLIGAQEVKDDSSDAGSVVLSIPIEQSTLADSSDEASGNGHSLVARIKWYRFKPSLSDEMEHADIILSHAGAGTLLEALALSSSCKSHRRKAINAVINSTLMDNHQLELAEELERRQHILVTRDCASEWTTDMGARKFWQEIGAFQPVPFVGGQSRGSQNANEDPDANVSSFQRIVDAVMGFRQHSSAKKMT